MARGELRRISIAVATGILASAALLALLVVVNQGVGLAGCVAATPLGWTAVLLSALVIAAAAAFLLMGGRRIDDAPGSSTAACPFCGRSVPDGWRLCPYCGREADATGPAESKEPGVGAVRD